MRILYVEDNLANVSLVKRVARNHEVINYIDGADALRNFANDKPDMVLMDVQLAGALNGLEVVKELRNRGYTLPIIAVTAYAMLGDRERCLSAGCDDYLPKPLPIPRLVEIISLYDEATQQGLFKKAETQLIEDTLEMEAIVLPADEVKAQNEKVKEKEKEEETTAKGEEAEKADTPVIIDDHHEELKKPEDETQADRAAVLGNNDKPV